MIDKNIICMVNAQRMKAISVIYKSTFTLSCRHDYVFIVETGIFKTSRDQYINFCTVEQKAREKHVTYVRKPMSKKLFP